MDGPFSLLCSHEASSRQSSPNVKLQINTCLYRLKIIFTIMQEQVENKYISKWPIPALLIEGIAVGIYVEQVVGFALVGLVVGMLMVYVNSEN